jgi:hypothetical protein
MPFIEGVPTVTLKLDKPRTLAFTMGAMRRIQERLGTLDITKDVAGGLLTMPTYIWACMDADARKEITVEEVEDMIHPGNMGEIGAAIDALFGASNPEGATEAEVADPTTAGPKLATG